MVTHDFLRHCLWNHVEFEKNVYPSTNSALKYGEESDPGQSSSSCGLKITDENDTDSKIQAEASEWAICLSVTESISSIFAIMFFFFFLAHGVTGLGADQPC